MTQSTPAESLTILHIFHHTSVFADHHPWMGQPHFHAPENQDLVAVHGQILGRCNVQQSPENIDLLPPFFYQRDKADLTITADQAALTGPVLLISHLVRKALALMVGAQHHLVHYPLARHLASILLPMVSQEQSRNEDNMEAIM